MDSQKLKAEMDRAGEDWAKAYCYAKGTREYEQGSRAAWAKAHQLFAVSHKAESDFNACKSAEYAVGYCKLI